MVVGVVREELEFVKTPMEPTQAIIGSMVSETPQRGEVWSHSGPAPRHAVEPSADPKWSGGSVVVIS